MPKKVMIVEDNELNMKLFRDLIEASGYETVQTRNGMEAMDLARRHQPDLILMDIQLPEVSGLEVTKRSGRFGPYIQLGDGKEAKRSSIPKDIPGEDFDLDYALRLLSLPREVGAPSGSLQTFSV